MLIFLILSHSLYAFVFKWFYLESFIWFNGREYLSQMKHFAVFLLQFHFILHIYVCVFFPLNGNSWISYDHCAMRIVPFFSGWTLFLCFFFINLFIPVSTLNGELNIINIQILMALLFFLFLFFPNEYANSTFHLHTQL